MHSIEYYQKAFNSHMGNRIKTKEPIGLYRPVTYILGLGGKRLRPVLTLLSCELFGKHYKEALDAALAIEVFHNFSLVHDDIMDAAPLRRGKTTVHEKWDTNTAILSGDAMLINAYLCLEAYNEDTFKHLVKLLSKTAIEVCEGQQYDVDFETRDDVTIPEYLKMIEYKTAVLLATAMKMGAIVAGASVTEQKNIYGFGTNLGIAFQLQDDYLDAFGDPKTFGKQVGGDIIANKKTFLYLKAMEMGTQDQRKGLLDLFSIQPKDPIAKIETTKAIFIKSGAAEKVKREIRKYTEKAFGELKGLSIDADKKEMLLEFGKKLITREI